LHIGHGWSALMAHDMAHSPTRGAGGGAFRLRIEDIDGARSRPEHVAGIIEDLTWLGIAWDGDVVFQSARLEAYANALDRLKARALVYPCFCTRAEIQAQWAASASAPQGEEGPVYPGTCRALMPAAREARLASGASHAWRLDMAAATARAGPLSWQDSEAGTVLADPLPAGDVVLARKDAPASYHLSATIDDAWMGITDVVRGRDLFAATHIHRLLQALLGLPTPRYHHHPLLYAADGKRLAKRDQSLTLAELRASGVDPARLAVDLRAGVFPIGIHAR
jgi:glutamyl-Q tRNA(Asp) synthetase